MRDWGSEGCPPLGVVVGIQPLPPALASWEPGPPAWWKGLILTDKMVDGGGGCMIRKTIRSVPSSPTFGKKDRASTFKGFSF